MTLLKLFGENVNSFTFSQWRIKAFLCDMDGEIALGDTMRNPAFTNRSGQLRRFDIVTANPLRKPDFPEGIYRKDTNNRFEQASLRHRLQTGDRYCTPSPPAG